MEEEYEQQTIELQWEVNSLKKSLEKQRVKRKTFDEATSNTIEQLNEQNQILNMQVEQSGKKEKQLVSSKKDINSEIAIKKTSIQEHFSNIESLNKKISELVLSKVLFEKQIENVTKEIESMTIAVEHSDNRIRQMERRTLTQANAYRNHQKDCDKLRTTNQYLLDKLEIMLASSSSNVNQPRNLQLEIGNAGPNNNDAISDKGSEMSYEDIDKQDEEEPQELDEELDNLKSEVLTEHKEIQTLITDLMRRHGQSEALTNKASIRVSWNKMK